MIDSQDNERTAYVELRLAIYRDELRLRQKFKKESQNNLVINWQVVGDVGK